METALNFLKSIFKRPSNTFVVNSSSNDETNRTITQSEIVLTEQSKKHIDDAIVIALKDKNLKPLIFEEVSSERTALFTIFGIFATLVTFVLVEVSVLKNASNIFELASLSLILSGIMLGFVITLDYLGKQWILRDNLKRFEISKLIWFASFLVLIGLFVAYYGYANSNNNQNKLSTMQDKIFQLETSIQKLTSNNELLAKEVDSLLNQKTQPIIIYGK